MYASDKLIPNFSPCSQPSFVPSFLPPFVFVLSYS
jgi:hypothetical protein